MRHIFNHLLTAAGTRVFISKGGNYFLFKRLIKPLVPALVFTDYYIDVFFDDDVNIPVRMREGDCYIKKFNKLYITNLAYSGYSAEIYISDNGAQERLVLGTNLLNDSIDKITPRFPPKLSRLTLAVATTIYPTLLAAKTSITLMAILGDIDFDFAPLMGTYITLEQGQSWNEKFGNTPAGLNIYLRSSINNAIAQLIEC